MKIKIAGTIKKSRTNSPTSPSRGSVSTNFGTVRSCERGDRGITCITIDYDTLRGFDNADERLFGTRPI